MTAAGRQRLFLLALGLPAVAYVTLVAFWPLARGIWWSFWDYNLIRPRRTAFVGLENYVELAADPSARSAVVNTLLFTAMAVGLELVIGLALALLLWRDDRFNRIVLALLLIPASITPLAVGLVAKALLSVEFGWIGYWAREAGLVAERGFFGYPWPAFLAIVAVDVWQWTPLMALILLAGLKTLPGETLEAARVDGADGPALLVRIILPMLTPAILIALVLRSMDAFRLFDSVFVTTKGGPGDATNVLLLYAVKQGLEFFNIGYAAAISNVMLVLMALIAGGFIVAMRRAERRVAA